MITLGSSTSNRGPSFSRIRRHRGSKPDSRFSGPAFRLRPRCEFMEDRTLLSTFDVTNTADSGAGSLRQAILDSNAATAATNTIDFAIPGNGVQTIAPVSPLPAITQPVLIDGFSQPGYAGSPLIELSGSRTGTSDGLLITGSNVTIRGLDVNGFAQGAGIHITGASATGDWIYGNFLGTDPTGKQAVPNNIGVEIDAGSTSNLVGTNGDGVDDASERNLLSGNLLAGVWITGQGTSNNAVAGNFIGTDITGSVTLNNGTQWVTDSLGNEFGGGVVIAAGASGNRIGTDGKSIDDVGERNVIAGSGNDGIDIYGKGTDDNIVAGNFIGTDVTGTLSLGIAGDGVFLAEGASSNWIGVNPAGGQAVSDEGNLISGNGVDGVQIQESANDNVVAGNKIGTDVTGTMPLGNTDDGVQIDGGAANNTIGGTTAGAGNVISANGNSGIWITGAGTTGVVVQQNLIGTDVTGTKPLGNTDDGVEIDNGAKNTTIGGTTAGAGNVISDNGQNGIWITGAGTTGVVVEHNFIGTDVTGTKALGNAYPGVEISGGAVNNTIGGTTAGAGNVISANDENGLWITGAGTTGVVVEQNFIGTDVTGTKALGNAYPGVEISGGAVNNTIGGTTAGAGNVISANDENGLWITGAGTTGVVVEHNFIGTDVTGTKALGNAYPGVEIGGGAANTTIGGTTADAGNVISANDENGLWITGAGTTGVVVEHNFIGTDVTGTKPLGNTDDGVEISGGAVNNTIGGTTADAGNVISANDENGLWITGAGTTGVVVEHNFIGTDVTGTKALGNAYPGVEISGGAVNNTIGGTTAGAGNVISANDENGLWITGAGTTGVVVEHNFIGTDVTGTKALGNAYPGVEIGGGAANTTIGGTTAGAGNVISANDENGLWITGAGTTGVVVEHNFIGTDVTGTKPLGNTDDGVEIDNGAKNTTIGGTTAGAGNVISDNGECGIWISDAGTTGVVVQQNLIGTDVTGTKPLGNTYSGVGIAGGAANNTIGGTAAGAGNVISANGQNGIWITGAGTTGVVVEHNFIGTDVTGTKALGNAYPGVEIGGGAANTTIGGTTADAGNVISANQSDGILITGQGTSNNAVAGNFIGTDVTGTKPLGNTDDGVEIDNGAKNTTIGGTTADAGNVISDNGECGIWISDAGTTGVVVEHNFIGTDVTGTKPLGNTYSGVGIAGGAANNTIGGTAAGAGNVISANGQNGIWITGAGTTGVVVEHNFIGTDVTGTKALGNAYPGVEIGGGAANTTIGGTTAGAGNVISANQSDGILITGQGTSNNAVAGNFIGTDVTGTMPLGNTDDGVQIDGGAANTTIGGTTAGAGNVISANGECGIWISDAGTTGVVVEHNFIGTDVTGTKALGNTYSGVGIAGGAANNTIGGTAAGAGNVISANGQNGIWITGAGTTGVVVEQNFIGTDVTGTKALGNAYPGVEISGGAVNNTIGGTTAGAGNVISANQSDGILITGTGTTGVVVEHNFIGTDVTGTKALGNADSGVLIDGGAANTTIGGTTADARNVISANGNSGIWITGAFGAGTTTTGVVVEQNFIGTDVTSTKALGNAIVGVTIDGAAANTTIGGTTADAGNVISANKNGGILITGAGTTGVVLEQNLIGTDLTGTIALGNANFGVQIDNPAAVSQAGGLTSSQAGGLTSSDGVFHAFDFPSGTLVDAPTLGGYLSGPPQGQSGGGPTAVYPIDVETDGMLSAIVQPQGFSARLTMLDSQGRVLVQSDGLSPSDPYCVIDQDLTPGHYSLVVESTGGAGSYTLTTTLTPASAPSQPIPVGVSPAGIVAGDFGNGHTDLAVANYGSDDVSIFLGNGDGTFQNPVTYAVGSAPIALVAGDFGNGHTDLAVANYYGNTVSVLLGNGDGTFQNPVTYAVGSEPIAIVAGDFGNGHTDLAVVNRGASPDSGSVSVLLGNGHGTFQPQVTYAVGSEPEAIVAGDFGNGHTDLAVANYGSNDVSVLLGNGHGTFQKQVTYAVGSEPRAIVAGDFTGNGHTDLAVANYYDNDVSVLLGNGHGTFFQDPNSPYQVGNGPDAIVAGDFTGDGLTDLAVANRGSNDVSVLLGNGNGHGTFQDQMTYPVGPEPEAIVAGDFTSDGRTELALDYYGSNDVSILLGNGHGTFQNHVLNVLGDSPPAIVAGDFTDDGRTDLAVANSGSDDVSILLGNGDGTFQNPVTYAVGTDPIAIVAGDFNGDGCTDLAVVNEGTYPNYSGSVSILLGNGDGTFQDRVTYAVGTDPIAIVAGDFGNGHTDLAVVNELDDDVSILLGNGDGTFQDGGTYAVGSYPDAIVAGYFTGDGRIDLAVANYRSGDVSILLGNGDGTFQDGGTYAVGSYPDAIVAGYFTGDGRIDLAVANYGSNNVSILLGNGHGTFQPLATYPVGNGPSAIVAGDFGNGHTDLAVANYYDNDVSILLGNGNGTFFQDPNSPYQVGACPDAIVAGDFNGDGRTDLALANLGSNDVSILLGNGCGTFAAPGQFATNPCATPLVADVNGDGTDDVLVVDGAGNILYRQGIPGQPGTFEPPITVNPGTPSRDIAWVPDTDLGPVLASVDANDNAISLYAYRDGGFVWVESLATGHLPAQIIAANLNGDGMTDLVVRNAGDGTLSVFFGTEFVGPINPQFVTPQFFPPVTVPVGQGVSDVQAIDTTGSGLLDLVVTNQVSGQLGILRNLGNGTFGPLEPYRAGTGPSAIDTSSGAPVVTSLEVTAGVAAGPFTTGAPTDLLTVNPGSNTLCLLAGLGDGRFANPVNILKAGPTQVVRVAYFNQDGIPYIAVLGNDTVSIYYLGNGQGGFSAVPVSSYNAGLDPTGLTVADLNGPNGNPDLLIGNEYGDVLVLAGQGNGTFRPLLDSGENVALAVADLTGNGTKDIIYASQNLNNVVVDYGGGDRLPVGASSGLLAPGAVAVDYLNGKNKPPDLIVANSGGNNVLVYPGLPNGQFGPALNGGKGFFTGTDPVGVTVADLTGNGRLDLVVADKGSNDVTILLNEPTADGGFTFVQGPRLNLKTATQQGIGPVATAIVPSPTGGPASLAVSVSGSNQVWLIPGVGGGFFNDQNPTIFDVGSNPGPILVGNLDGKPILVTLNHGSNNLTVIYDPMGSDPVTRTISSGGLGPVAAIEFSPPGSDIDIFVVANNDDGIFALLEVGPDGLNLTATETAPGVPNPTDLALLAFTDGQVQFYAVTEGSEAATLLTFQLGGETGGMPAVPGLQPLSNSALPLIATLLTLTIETSTAELNPGVSKERLPRPFHSYP